jgi:hypothetical protein
MNKKLRYGPQRQKATKGHGPLVDVLFEIVNNKQNPRAAILVAQGFIELLVDTLVKSRCEDAKDIGYFAKLLILRETKSIDDEWFRRLDRLRKIRHRAAHEPFFELTRADLKIYEPAEAFLKKGVSYKKPNTPQGLAENFVQTLYMMFGAFWNDYRLTLGPVFGQPRLVPGIIY